MCNGTRNLNFNAKSIFQTETRSSGDDSIYWNRMWNRNFLQRLSIRNGVSKFFKLIYNKLLLEVIRINSCNCISALMFDSIYWDFRSNETIQGTYILCSVMNLEWGSNVTLWPLNECICRYFKTLEFDIHYYTSCKFPLDTPIP